MAKNAKVEAGKTVSPEVAAFAQKSVDQAQQAFEKVNEIAHSNVQVMDAAASAYRARLADLQLRAMEITQINVNAGFALARKMFAVKEVGDLVSMQQDFIREQAQVMQRQAAEMSELAMSLAKETAKPVQEGLTRTMGELGKTFPAGKS